MAIRKKYALPAFAELPHIDIDLDKLRAEADRFAHKYIDVESANPALCDNHKMLVSQVYDNFTQINLTELNGEPPVHTTDIRERIRRGDEKLYNKETEDYKASYFKELINQFKNPKMRVRITKLDAGRDIPFHIDYDPTYAVRVIIPIYTNTQVLNKFRIKGDEVETHFEAGKAYFLNTGFAHGVYNMSDQPRIALMFSLDGQDDITDIQL